MFDAWIVMIVAPMFRQFQIRSLEPSVAATLIFETVLIFKVGLEAFCMTILDSSVSLYELRLFSNFFELKPKLTSSLTS
jgi:hypothetical protein